MKKFTAMAVLITLLTATASAEEYLGNYSGNKYNPNSTSNPYGAGSSYSAKSINNPYGRYGSPYSSESVNNPYGAGSPHRSDSPNNPHGEGLGIYRE